MRWHSRLFLFHSSRLLAEYKLNVCRNLLHWAARRNVVGATSLRCTPNRVLLCIACVDLCGI